MQEKVFELKNGKSVQLRYARREDAAALIRMMQLTYGESDFLTCYPDEFSLTVEMEEKWIEKFDHQKSAMFVITDGEEILGNAAINPISSRAKVSHRCVFGITVVQAYWHQGLGRKLMQAAVDFAQAAGYEQIELEVISENFRAIPLYQSFGFETYGTRPRAFRLRDGRYLDEYLMVKKIR